MRSHVRVALAFSFAANVLLAGMLIGEISHRFVPPPPRFDVSAQLEKLPQEKRALYESIMTPAKQQMDADRAQIDKAKKEAMRLFERESFDEKAYMEWVSRIELMHTQMKQKLAKAVVSLARQLTPEERAVFAEIIMHPPFAPPPPPPPAPPGMEKDRH